MRIILLFFLTSVLSTTCLAQWPKTYGHNTFDAVGRVIKTTNDGGFLIGGAERLSNNGRFLGYIRKTDINGVELWKRYINESATSNNVLGISENANGELLLTGTNNDQMDGFAIKLNACGEKLWCKVFQISSQNMLKNNILLADNGYIIHADQNRYNYDRIWLYRLDAEGNLLWQKCMEPDPEYFDETGYRTLLTNDSCILISGFNFFIREPGSNLGWFSPLWVKFDLDGNQLWDLTWYGNGFIHGDNGQTTQDAAGNYYGAGSDGFQEEGMTACFFKFSPDGTPMKLVNVYDQGSGSAAKSISFFQDSTLFIGAQYGIGTTGYSIVLRCDTTGQVLKTKDVPLYGFPVAYSALTADNKVVALGERVAPGMNHWETCLFKFNQNLDYDSTYTVPRVYDSLCPHPVVPEAFINLDCIIVDTEEPLEKPENSQLKVYPLPANERVTIALPDYYVQYDNSNHIKTTTTYYQLTGNKTIELYDVHGRQVATYAIAEGETSVTFDVSTWSSGLYLARLICKGKVWAQGKVMVR